MYHDFMSILVTGSSGLIGYQAVLSLVQAGFDVIAAYRKNNPAFQQVPAVNLYLTDNAANTVMEHLQPDTIVHCAAMIPPKWSEAGLDELALYNRKIDATVIEYCQNHPDCSLIYISGTSLYGSVQRPVDESAPLFPQCPYLTQKAESEAKIITLTNQAIILRVSAPYGAGQGAQTVISIFVQNALNSKPLYYFGSGQRTQDFTAVEDVGAAIAKAAYLKDVRGVFNIASGAPVSMKNLAELVAATIPTCKSQVMASGASDPQEGYRANFRINKAREVLGWRPKVGLKQGILKLAQFFKDTL